MSSCLVFLYNKIQVYNDVSFWYNDQYFRNIEVYLLKCVATLQPSFHCIIIKGGESLTCTLQPYTVQTGILHHILEGLTVRNNLFHIFNALKEKHGCAISMHVKPFSCFRHTMKSLWRL